ncbi:hypothetical protein N1851_028848 [Merluccius polli]|uniref:Uncharacterized protein n=1 Tax=Merluccius polli TaxID=89951 RepID=A0AA47M7X4_MERPO|nr:hypothetical protein N1851_028848 [Merluccius polli]
MMARAVRGGAVTRSLNSRSRATGHAHLRRCLGLNRGSHPSSSIVTTLTSQRQQPASPGSSAAMSIVEPLGVQLDMQLLLKLSLSVASVLLVTWVYRYFSSRGSGTTACLPSARVPDPGEAGEPQDGEAACRDSSGAAARPQAELKGAAGKRERREGGRPHGGSNQTSDRTGRPPANNIKQSRLGETRSVADPDQKCSNGEGEAASQIKRAEVSTCNVSFDTATLNLPGAGERWGPEGVHSRHSPRFLQRLERSVGVGRELRQDMDHRGAHSSFLSKAEIKVEHANLVLEGAGSDLVVRGKIYDYFVQSSSHSVTDSEPVFGHIERTPSPDSKPGELSESHSRGGGGGGRLVETRSPLSSIIMRDLVLGESAEEPLLLATPPEPGPPAKPALLRKESYRSATEHSTLTTPCLTAGASTPGSPSQTSPCEEPHSASPGISSSMMNTAGRHSRDAPVLETLAGGSVFTPASEKPRQQRFGGS